MAYTVSDEAKVIGESSFGFGQSNVVTLSTGEVYAAFVNDSGEVEVCYRETTGSFTCETTFTGTNIQAILSLCPNNSGELFLCYKTGTDTAIVKKRTSGGTWSEVLNYTTAALTGESTPLITINKTTGRLYLVMTYVLASLARTLEIRYTDDSGDNWTQALTNLAGHASAVDAALWGARVDEVSSRLYAYIGMYGKQYVAVLSSVGLSITTEGPITDTIYGGALDVDASGNRYQLTYYENGGTYYLDLFINGVTDTVWSAASDWLKHGMIDVVVDYLSDIYVLYTKTDGKIYYRWYDDSTSTWSSETEYDTGYRPSIEKYSDTSTLQVVYYQVG